MICQPNFRGIGPNRPFLTPRDIVEPHNMRLNHIENRLHVTPRNLVEDITPNLFKLRTINYYNCFY